MMTINKYLFCLALAAGSAMAQEGTTPLMECAGSGSAADVRALIAAGADVNAANVLGDTALMRAAQRGDKEKVAALLAAGANPNAQDRRGWTALMGACVSKNNADTAIARALLDAGAQLEIRNERGFSALSYAAQSNRLAHVRLLLTAGADANSRDEYGRNVLWRAVECKASVAVLRALLEAGASATDKEGERGILFYAVRRGYGEDVLRMLLKAGADVNAGSPLCGAVLMNTQAVEFLLASGADVNAESALALRLAVHATPVVVPVLLKAGADVNLRCKGEQRTALHEAVDAGVEGSVALLLAAGADVNAADKRGITPFLEAVRRGNLSIASQLLESGADPLAADAKGRTALQLLCNIENELLPLQVANRFGKVSLTENDYTRMVRCLKAMENCPAGQRVQVWQRELEAEAVLPAAADGVDAASPCTGRTRLMQAADRHDMELLKQCLAAGAEVNRQDAFGNTALMYALTRPGVNGGSGDLFQQDTMVPCVELLLRAGADANKQNAEGTTALMLAGSHQSLVKMLLESHADVSLRDKAGHTALHRAACRVNGAMVFEQLLKAGSPVDVRTPEGATPLMLAASCKDAPELLGLVAAGADVNARDHVGRTVLDYARTAGVVAYLRAQGARSGKN